MYDVGMRTERTCLWCGQPIGKDSSRDSRKRYCKRLHSRFARTAKKSGTLHQRSEARDCVICFVALPIPHRANLRTCSDDCRQELQRRYGRGDPFGQRIFQPKVCIDCRADFETLQPTAKRCDGCRQKEIRNRHTHSRRCRKYGVPFQPLSIRGIFIRDKWTCQICGSPTPEELRGTNDSFAPELDHVIPLAMGPGVSPGHVPLNCQCACRRCNRAKNEEWRLKYPFQAQQL